MSFAKDEVVRVRYKRRDQGATVVSERWLDKGTPDERVGVRVRLDTGETVDVEASAVQYPPGTRFRCLRCGHVSKPQPVPVFEMRCGRTLDCGQMRPV